MVTLYGIPNCNQIRKTRAWLEEHDVSYDFIDLKKEPLSREKLEWLVSEAGLGLLVNRRGMKWRQLGLAKKDLSDAELFEELLEHQVMIKRPLLVAGTKVQVGYDEAALESIANEVS